MGSRKGLGLNPCSVTFTCVNLHKLYNLSEPQVSYLEKKKKERKKSTDSYSHQDYFPVNFIQK